ncbi:MAG: YafY family transcriptional regulator [Spirochaetaceae bacterium]
MRIDRMLSITIILLGRERVSAKELSKRFEVSSRTIYRDIEAINLAGIPIISLQGRDGGFGIMEGFKLDKQIFTTRDMASILSSLEGINRGLESNEIKNVVEKLHSLIPNNQKEEVTKRASKLLIDITPWGDSEKRKKRYKEIDLAIERQKVLEIKYINPNGEESIRNIEPMTLVYKNFTWYIWSFCQKRNDFRIFKMNRIIELKTLDTSFINKGVIYKENSDYKLELINIKLKADLSFKGQAIEKFGVEFITEYPTYLEINTTFPEGAWIHEFILSLGSSVEVLYPLGLRNKMISLLNNMNNLYK